MKKKFYLIFLFVCSFYSSLIGQSQLSYYGHTIPVNTNSGTNGSLRIMIVFVELVGSCAPNDQPDWHPGSLPTNVNTHYFDANFTNNPSNYISKYFWEASFGQFKVEGDYVADLIQIPCTSIDPVTDVLTALDNRELAGTLGFGTYSSITEFDHYSIAGIGDFALKTNNSNGFIDGMIICFRNSPYTPCSSGGGSGGGCIEYNSQPGTVGAMGIDAGCAFGMCANLNSVQMIIAEFFHAMYGHNNWHLGDGAGPHAFPFKTNPWGIATQSNGAGSSNVVSAWDRDFCGWYGWSDINKTIHKNDLIMAKDNSANDIVTDFELNNFPVTAIDIVLRDFVTYGDAIRIKMPFIECNIPGDTKNQYLWIENHQLFSDYDHSLWENNSCKEPWVKGLYTYMQIGKDVKDNSGTFTLNAYPWTSYAEPNTLGSWLFPISAEGNYDFDYGQPFKDQNNSGCVWNQWTTPTNMHSSNTLPNPLTGYSELFNFYNTNGDNQLRRGSTLDYSLPGYSELDAQGNITFNVHSRGDTKDAFNFANNSTLLSISTNPSPVPVYTYASPDLTWNPCYTR